MRAAVLGHPIAHSLSPYLHRAAYDALGLDGWTYDAIDVDVSALPGVVAALDAQWAGLSLTMPLKQEVIGLLAEVSDLARQVGAVNTVIPAGAGRWRGENTDVAGILAALAEVGTTRATTAAVLGGGATASSALAALAALGARQAVVHVRSALTADRVRATADTLTLHAHLAPWPGDADATAALLQHDVVISTVPSGAADALARLLADDAHGATPVGPAPREPGTSGTLLDVVYVGLPTPLLQVWHARGGRAVDGTAMLLHQAARQVELMTGRPAPLAAMRQALQAALSVRPAL